FCCLHHLYVRGTLELHSKATVQLKTDAAVQYCNTSTFQSNTFVRYNAICRIRVVNFVLAVFQPVKNRYSCCGLKNERYNKQINIIKNPSNKKVSRDYSATVLVICTDIRFSFRQSPLRACVCTLSITWSLIDNQKVYRKEKKSICRTADNRISSTRKFPKHTARPESVSSKT
ncbi:hypothetical protein AGLY_006258, partial [Aphis glycines]